MLGNIAPQIPAATRRPLPAAFEPFALEIRFKILGNMFHGKCSCGHCAPLLFEYELTLIGFRELIHWKGNIIQLAAYGVIAYLNRCELRGCQIQQPNMSRNFDGYYEILIDDWLLNLTATELHSQIRSMTLTWSSGLYFFFIRSESYVTRTYI